MYELSVHFNGTLIGNYEFDQDTVTIGRSPSCEVPIDNLGVSRFHARIEQQGEFFLLKDLQSNNGTFVRGQRIQKYNLNNGDIFFVGKYRISFNIKNEECDWQGEKHKSSDVFDSYQAMTMEVDEDPVIKMHVTDLVAYLSLTDSRGTRQDLSISKSAIFFGSHPECDYYIQGWGISKRHVEILREDTGFRLIHLGNKKAPKINGVTIDSHKLQDGDVIEVENWRLVFHVGQP